MNFDPTNQPDRLVFGSPARLHQSNRKPMNTPGLEAGSLNGFSNSNNNWMGQAPKCSQCLDLGHTKKSCHSVVRCLLCFNLGHFKRKCPSRLTKHHRPIWEWRPKATRTLSEPHLEWRPKVHIQSIIDEIKPAAVQNPSIAKPEPIDEVFHLSDDSSDSSDATSMPNEESIRFQATLNHCVTLSLFHRKNIPGFMHAGPLMQPITIDKNNFLGRDDAHKQDITVATGWEIVPCKLITDVLALQSLASCCVSQIQGSTTGGIPEYNDHRSEWGGQQFWRYNTQL
jgi:hypothetical protein